MGIDLSRDLHAKMQSALRPIYPPQCISCPSLVESDFGLCGSCWKETPFAVGLVCDKCGLPLPGEEADTNGVLCDDCIRVPRPWTRGRAVLVYRDNARKLVLSLKHGDRTELATPAADWMLRVAQPLLRPGQLVVPVPLHWTRLFLRRYNQAALLAQRMARRAGLAYAPDLLARVRRTSVMDGLSFDKRFSNVAGAISITPRRRHMVAGRSILLVDDVMTSGATLTEATEALMAAGAFDVSVVALARVAKGG